MPAAALSAHSTLAEILEAIPGARRALFRLYHIGGCQSCAFSPAETLAELCARNSLPAPEDVLAAIEREAATEARLLISPHELAQALATDPPPALYDLRSPEEFAAVHIPGSRRLDQPAIQELLANPSPTRLIVLIDHRGERSLDAAAYFIGHGLQNIRALRGGIDAYSLEADPSLPRYTLQ